MANSTTQHDVPDHEAPFSAPFSATFSSTHADLLDLFERWEVLADGASEAQAEPAPPAAVACVR